MAGSVNKTILVGRLGKDPEVRRTQSGDPVVSFSLATSNTWRDKDSGERKERTSWHQVVVFNTKLCEVAEKYLKKGSLCYVEGELQTREYEKDGDRRFKTEIVLQRFRGELQLMDKAEGRPAPEPDDYGTTRTRDNDPSSDRGSNQYAEQKGREYSGVSDFKQQVEQELDDKIPY